jgi:hypothetical protein
MSVKILTLSTALLFSATLLFAQQVQQAPKLPVDEKSGLISYSKVHEVSGATAGTLYQRALEWANKFYKTVMNSLKSTGNSSLIIRVKGGWTRLLPPINRNTTIIFSKQMLPPERF